MPYTPQQVNHLMTFVGYGNPSGVWFLGMEEAGGGIANLDARLEFRNPIEDLHHAHVNLLGIDVHHRTAPPPKLQPTWRRMCELMLLREGVGPIITREQKRSYQRQHLGRVEGGTFLSEFMPIPAPNLGEWDAAYVEALGLARIQYLNAYTQPRQQLIAEFIQIHQPPLIIAHGAKYAEQFMGLFPGRKFERDSDNNFWYSLGTPLVVVIHNLHRINDTQAVHNWIRGLEARHTEHGRSAAGGLGLSADA